MVGGTDTFSYTGTPAGDISSNNGTITADVAPGQYTSTEAAKAGWDLTALTCDDANSTGSVANRQATFNVAAGETVTCTFTNRKQGTVIVKKVMVGGTDTFSYTGTPAGSIDTQQRDDLRECRSGHVLLGRGREGRLGAHVGQLRRLELDGSVGTRTASFDVAAGETVTCTFTNTKQATVIVKKVMVGGTDSFSYTGTPSGAIAVNNGTISANVIPGQYVSTESAKTGWDLTSLTCDDTDSTGSVANRQATFNVAAGETVTCTFTNTKRGTVIVKKVMQGGTDSFGYTGTPNGTIAVNNGTISADVAPGQYASTEGSKAGWDLTAVVCDDGNSTGSVANRQATFNVEAGETVTCTFTNRKQGSITVKKIMVGGTDTFSYSGTPSGSISQNNGTLSQSVEPGQYTSTEAAKDGWDLTSVVCDDANSSGSVANRQATFNVEAGEAVTCTFTNTKSGKIVVAKQTNPKGDTQSFAFSASYNQAGFSLSDGQSNDSGTLAPGTYSVSENVPAGWDLDSATCDDGSAPGSIGLAAGETVTCTFVNEKDSNIVVRKQTNPSGDPQSFVFNASYDANGFSLSDGQSNDSGDIDPGTYSVSENVPQGLGSRLGYLRRRLEPELDRPRCRRDGDVHLRQREGLAHRHFQGDEPEGRPAVVHVLGELRPERFLARRRPVERLGRHRPGHVLRVRERAVRLGSLIGRVLGSEPRERDLAAGRRDRDLRVHEHEARNDHRREADGAGQGVRKLLVQRSGCRLDR